LECTERVFLPKHRDVRECGVLENLPIIQFGWRDCGRVRCDHGCEVWEIRKGHEEVSRKDLMEGIPNIARNLSNILSMMGYPGSVFNRGMRCNQIEVLEICRC
jgi:hypothetical protein